MRALLTAALVLVAPAAHAWDNNFKVKNCDSAKVRICAYEASDSVMNTPSKTSTVKSGNTSAFGCNDGVYKNPKECRVHLRKGDTSGCGKAKTAKQEHFTVQHDQTIYVWFEDGARKWSSVEPASCGAL